MTPLRMLFLVLLMLLPGGSLFVLAALAVRHARARWGRRPAVLAQPVLVRVAPPPPVNARTAPR